jgi:hypothetical protein
MRISKTLGVGLLVASLAGCGGSILSPSAAGPPATASSSAPSPGTSPRAHGSPGAVSGVTRASSANPVKPGMKAGARAAAANFYGLYSANRFAASWDLLTSTTRRLIPRHVWVTVHEACPSAGAAKARVIEAVTVFGDAAIITEKVPGAPPWLRTTEDVFNYANGHWHYSPGNLGIYEHGSVAADVAAAKAAGLCAGWKDF